jgi:hypothetical protein
VLPSSPIFGRSADNIRDHRHVTSLLQRAFIEPYGIRIKPTLTFDERGHHPAEVNYRVWAAGDKGGKSFLCDSARIRFYRSGEL